jgi:hypothetical protein
MSHKPSRIVFAALALLVLRASLAHGQICSTVSPVGKGVWQTEDRRPTGKPGAPEVAVLVNDALWEPGQELLVEFPGGRDDERLLHRVMQHIREWEQITNLRVVFLPPDKAPGDFGHEHAHVRITFRGQGYWSLVGNASIAEGAVNKPSMNLGGLTGQSDPDEVRRVVLHEFGHALGFAHEHQNPRGGIQWRMPDAMEYYRRITGWGEDTIRRNVFDALQEPGLFSTRFDRNSIMLYPIPRGLTTDGFSVGWNTRLSGTDKKAASAVYPSWYSAAVGLSARVPPGTEANGAIITSVDRRAPADRLRRSGDRFGIYSLEPGDRIVRVDNLPVNTFEEFQKAISSINGRFRLEVERVRSGKLLELHGRAD